MDTNIENSKHKLLVSFSGGETSAFMAQWLWKNKQDEYDMIFVFANTGQENEETLDFAKKCSDYFGFPVVWIEADVVHEKGKGTKSKVVTYETASRNGEPFEEVIKKYTIPSIKYLHCTRELKQVPIRHYARSLGWKNKTYYTAIGIRADEIDRVNEKHNEEKIIYPLISMVKMTKPSVNLFWKDMPFRLELKGYQGNCKWCWKKSLRKHLTIAKETPEYFDFPKRMEEKYGTDKNPTFFRSKMKVEDIIKLSQEPFEPAADDAVNYIQKEIKGNDLDLSNGCIESCEVF